MTGANPSTDEATESDSSADETSDPDHSADETSDPDHSADETPDPDHSADETPDPDSSADETSDTNDGATPEQLSETQEFEILQNPRRRHMLRYLAREGGEAEFGDLVDFVAARENDVSSEDLTDDQRRRVYVSLSQAHIPKLEERGIVVYHDDRGLVERLPTARQVERYMDDLTDESPPWAMYYLALALTAFVAVALRLVYHLDGVIFFTLALTTTILLVTVSVLHFASINGLLSS